MSKRRDFYLNDFINFYLPKYHQENYCFWLFSEGIEVIWFAYIGLTH